MVVIYSWQDAVRESKNNLEECTCEHTRENHEDLLEVGHGKCKEEGCVCGQFTWKGEGRNPLKSEIFQTYVKRLRESGQKVAECPECGLEMDLVLDIYPMATGHKGCYPVERKIFDLVRGIGKHAVKRLKKEELIEVYKKINELLEAYHGDMCNDCDGDSCRGDHEPDYTPDDYGY